ncbi:MAG: hypothetical protein GX147_02235 [Deltaproteobacteria bacterium]|nr:hypothetical protein [Deltaproteobacteria bacterium]
MRWRGIILRMAVGIFAGMLLWGCTPALEEQLKPFQVSYFRNKLMDVAFADVRHGWTSGDQGLILFTDDGGKHWARQNSGTQHTLRAISFIDAERGWMVGGAGTIIRTEDGGQTWKRLDSGTKDDLMCVKFLDEKRGFAAGAFSLFLRTEDGGQTWIDMTDQFSEEEAFMLDTSGMSMEEKMAALKEEFAAEGGEEEGESVIPLNPMINEIFFINPLKGWVVGEAGSIWTTDDGGLQWVKQQSGQLEDLFGVFFKDEEEGWVTGLNGTLLYTDNGGSTWRQQVSTVKQSLFGIAVSGDRGYAVGNAATMIETKDGGKTWKEFVPPSIRNFSWIRGLVVIKDVEDTYVAVGGLGTIMISRDSGISWEKIS